MVIMVCYDGSLTTRRALKLAQEHAYVWQAERGNKRLSELSR